ncbi:MAG: biotin--[acetyl-CoA-carboxylase] ligase family protein [Spirochaetes bacterium]|nr:biotin--[acetyl-CoA-carboxylase] ligase family protein [Spirochaetota bacterium]MBU1080718.1 biotin--[acetyl-CoA-carboxylase] ligase family protein [Spirochaetota bacterium]
MTESTVTNPFPESAAYYAEATTSTMDDARRLSPGSRYGLVHAGAQGSGRGRLPGRVWEAEPGSCVLATLWFPRDEFSGAPLPLVSGIAVLRACRSWAAESGARFREGLCLKWPNDVLCGPRKLSGILCESSGDTVYAGIGVNCLQTGFNPGFRTEPTSILLETGASAPPNDILARIAEEFLRLRGIGRGWKPAYEPMMAWLGLPVRFKPGLELTPIDGFLRGVDDSGAVLISGDGDDRGRATAYPSGELSPR